MLAASALALISALVLDAGQKPRWLVSDQDLWKIVRSGSDPFQGTSFENALQSKPLLVEAWIQQPIVHAIISALGTPLVSDVRLDEVAERAFCERNSALRAEHGGMIPVQALAASTEISMEAVAEMLSSLVVSEYGLSSQMRAALIEDKQSLLDAARSSADLAHQAALCAPEVDREAWESVSASYALLADVVSFIFSNDPESFGLDSGIPESWRVPTGHRAPHGRIARAQYLQMGGRLW